MKAMILAAGMGRRLRPLTNKTPKALIEIGGAPILERVIKRLIKAGVRELVINTHHKPQMIAEFLKTKKNFGLSIEISYEEKLLDTGGALKKVASFFNDKEPFFLHNVDVVSTIDLKEMYLFHQKNPALATLAVSSRKSSRYLLFDAQGFLRGWVTPLSGKAGTKKPISKTQRLAFNGIHVISPQIFSFMRGGGNVFSIIETYVKAAKEGEKIQAFRSDTRGCQVLTLDISRRSGKLRLDPLEGEDTKKFLGVVPEHFADRLQHPGR